MSQGEGPATLPTFAILTSKNLFSEEENGVCPALILSCAAGTGSKGATSLNGNVQKNEQETQERQERQETTTAYGYKRIFSCRSCRSCVPASFYQRCLGAKPYRPKRTSRAQENISDEESLRPFRLCVKKKLVADALR
jgi:hypothetical protein